MQNIYNLTSIAFFIFLVAIILRSNKAAIYLILAHIFLLQWLYGFWEIIPRQVTWISDIVIIILIFKVIFLISNGLIKIRRSPFDCIILFLFIVSIISSIANSVNIFTIFTGYRHFFKNIILFFILYYLNIEEKFLKKIITLIIVLAFIQLPIVILQRIYINADDLICGTLGYNNNQELSLFLIGIMAIITGYYINKKDFSKIKLLFGFIFLIIPMSLNQAKAAFFCLPAMFIFIFRKFLFGSFKKSVHITVIFVMIFLASINLADTIITRINISDYLTNPDKVFSYTFGSSYISGDLISEAEGGLRMGSAIVYSHNLISRNVFSALIGFGPGNASDSFFSNANGEYFDEILNYSRTQLSRTMLEWGYLGLFLFLILFYFCFRMNHNFYRNINDPFWKSISFGYNGILFLQVLSIIYIQSWTSDILSFWFWFLTSTILVIGKRNGIVEF